MIENLEKTIKEWGEANEKLYKVVKGMKAACFATATMLNIKNLFDGLSGKSMSRRELIIFLLIVWAVGTFLLPFVIKSAFGQEAVVVPRTPKTLEQKLTDLKGQVNLNSERIAQLGDEMDANFIVRDELLAHLVERMDELKNKLNGLVNTIQTWVDYFLGQETKKKKG